MLQQMLYMRGNLWIKLDIIALEDYTIKELNLSSKKALIFVPLHNGRF